MTTKMFPSSPALFLAVLKLPNCLLDISTWMLNKHPNLCLEHSSWFLITICSPSRCHTVGKPKTLLPSWFLSSPHSIYKQIFPALPPKYISNLSTFSIFMLLPWSKLLTFLLEYDNSHVNSSSFCSLCLLPIFSLFNNQSDLYKT